LILKLFYLSEKIRLIMQILGKIVCIDQVIFSISAKNSLFQKKIICNLLSSIFILNRTKLITIALS